MNTCAIKTVLPATLILLALGNVANADAILPAEVVISPENTIEDSLSGVPGDPFRGLEVFVDRKLGNCVACHTNFDVQAMQFLGGVGPNLDWIGDYYAEAEIRAILVDSKQVFGPDTIMPAFYTDREGFRTLEQFKGAPILTAQQLEDVVAYLSSLSRDGTFDGVD